MEYSQEIMGAVTWIFTSIMNDIPDIFQNF